MSGALERLGRFAAPSPWIVIGSWVAIGFLVITSAAAFGRDPEDPFEAPGLDSHRATDVSVAAGSAQLPRVMTSPGDEKGDHNHDHLHPTT